MLRRIGVSKPHPSSTKCLKLHNSLFVGPFIGTSLYKTPISSVKFSFHQSILESQIAFSLFTSFIVNSSHYNELFWGFKTFLRP